MKKMQGLVVPLLIVLLIAAGVPAEDIGKDNTQNYYYRTQMVDISIPSTASFQALLDRGITVLAVHQQSATVLVSDSELVWLTFHQYHPCVLYSDSAARHGWKDNPDLLLSFHTYDSLTDELQTIASLYPAITELYELGQSVQGRSIWGLKITDNPHLEENEPEVRICGLHHGDELMSMELPLLLAWHLVQNYSSDPLITTLVDHREIWILPMVNPDGREATPYPTRTNANGIDLNRNYGYMWGGWSGSSPFSEPEVQAVRDHALVNPFVLSLSFHTSGDIVNYIWNYKGEPVADHDVVEQLSLQYGSHNGYWVVEGYDWYQTRGDTNDFSYGCRGDIDWTIEVQNSNIQQAWNLNKDAMVELIEASAMGLSGIVTDAITGQPLEASIWVEDAWWPCFSDAAIGDYHKVLLPGTYTVHYTANGYEENVVVVEVTDTLQPIQVNVSLHPASNRYFAHQVTWCNFYDPYSYPNNFQNNPTEAVAALGAPDGVCASLGVGGTLVVDMQTEIEDREGAADIRIVEGDGSDDGYHVSVAQAWNGPWVEVGSGFGTTEFDLATGPIDVIRFIKLVDDADGNPYDQHPGVDIDALVNLAPVVANAPPEAPDQPSGPEEGETGLEYTFTTCAIDPESNEVYYQWNWGDEIGPWIGPFASNVTIGASHIWSQPGAYELFVRAKDQHGAESPWSTPHTIHITGVPAIEIGNITGGFGVKAEILNRGTGEATDVHWTITLDGFVILGKETKGEFTKIMPGFTPKAKTGLLLGLGRVAITVTAEEEQKLAQGLIFGPLVVVYSQEM
jgi:hypothetical protein